MTGTRVTCEDLVTGETETTVIADDYAIVCDGNRYIDGMQVYPKSGTVIVTIKRRDHASALHASQAAPDSALPGLSDANTEKP